MAAVDQRIQKRLDALNFDGFAGVAASTAVMICTEEFGKDIAELRAALQEEQLTQMVMRVGAGPQPGEEWVPVTPAPIGPRVKL